MNGFWILAASAALGLTYLVGSLIFFAGFPMWRSLDFLMLPGQIERALSLYSDADVMRHLWATRIGDTIFPAYYGVVVGLLCWRYFAGWKLWAMLALTLVAVVADYVENAYTVRLLLGQGGVWPHVIATWIKFAAITLPMDLGLIYLWREVKERRASGRVRP